MSNVQHDNPFENPEHTIPEQPSIDQLSDEPKSNITPKSNPTGSPPTTVSQQCNTWPGLFSTPEFYAPGQDDRNPRQFTLVFNPAYINNNQIIRLPSPTDINANIVDPRKTTQNSNILQTNVSPRSGRRSWFRQSFMLDLNKPPKTSATGDKNLDSADMIDEDFADYQQALLRAKRNGPREAQAFTNSGNEEQDDKRVSVMSSRGFQYDDQDRSVAVSYEAKSTARPSSWSNGLNLDGLLSGKLTRKMGQLRFDPNTRSRSEGNAFESLGLIPESVIPRRDTDYIKQERKDSLGDVFFAKMKLKGKDLKQKAFDRRKPYAYVEGT